MDVNKTKIAHLCLSREMNQSVEVVSSFQYLGGPTFFRSFYIHVYNKLSLNETTDLINKTKIAAALVPFAEIKIF